MLLYIPSSPGSPLTNYNHDGGDLGRGVAAGRVLNNGGN
jgi:hypothetical protein